MQYNIDLHATKKLHTSNGLPITEPTSNGLPQSTNASVVEQQHVFCVASISPGTKNGQFVSEWLNFL